MLKVVTLLTGRYKKILKRGEQDRIKLLFRSLAVFDRRASMAFASEKEKSTKDPAPAEQKPHGVEDLQRQPPGFAIDEAIDDGEEEDDDDLVLAALDALDAIEVFKQDQRTERRMYLAQIPIDNFIKLVRFMLAIAPLGPLDPLARFGDEFTDDHIQELTQAAEAVVAACKPDRTTQGIRYSSFVKTMSVALPYLFDPLSPLFEHLLFSKNIDLSRHRGSSASEKSTFEPWTSPIQRPSQAATPSILNDAMLSQLATFLRIAPKSSSASTSPLTAGVKYHSLYSTNSHGTSLSSFAKQVLSWHSPTLLLLAGNLPSAADTSIVLGAYLHEQWTESRRAPSTSDSSTPPAMMFQLRPTQAIFRANPYNKTTPVSYFSSKAGIALGCVPPASRSHSSPDEPVLGPVSLRIDSYISTATFQHDGDAGIGTFVTDPGFEESQRRGEVSWSTPATKKVEIDIDTMEVWGIVFAAENGDDEISKQKERMKWEEAEAARRRGVNFGSDKEGARALLEMAGLVGDDAQNRSGGSV